MSAATTHFDGFTRDAIQFLVELTENNNRAWFTPRKADYERLLKQPMEQLCVALAERLERRGIPLRADPKKSPFRIYRDTRFSHNKEPYKTNVAASFPWVGSAGGQAEEGAHGNGGYFNFRPGNMYMGGGMWMPQRAVLEAFRGIVRDEPGRARGAVEEPGFVAWFGGGVRSHEELKRVPPGYPAEHPLADMFRWKDVVFGRSLSDDEVISPVLPDTLADGFAAALPVLRFLAGVQASVLENG